MRKVERKKRTEWRKALEELLFPPCCVICSTLGAEVSNGLCRNCLAEVNYVRSPICVVCGRNFLTAESADHICGQCLSRQPPFGLARAITFYDEPVRTLLHRLKYNFDTTVIKPLLKIAQNYDFSVYNNVDFVVPVPLYHQNLRKRGHNHALQLAKIIFPERGEDIVVDLLDKHRQTISQTALDSAGRRANLKGAFSVKSTEKIKDKLICLVDDVFTTGTTVKECCKALKKGGAGEVIVLTFARVEEK